MVAFGPSRSRVKRKHHDLRGPVDPGTRTKTEALEEISLLKKEVYVK
jgi:hypothetical protein